MPTPESPVDDRYRLEAIGRLDQLIEDLSVQRAELARGPVQVGGTARIQAVAPVQAVLLYAREAMEEVVSGPHAYGRRLVETLVQAALAEEGQDLDAEDCKELRETSTLLLADILTVGQLDGAIDPEVWGMPVLSALVVHAVRESQKQRDLSDKVESL